MDGLDRERASDSQLADLVDLESAAAASVRDLDPAWLRDNCQCADCRDANLAFTGLPIGPHTDNPYRDPVPTVQLLHCLVSAADGGESGLLDGFRAAARLRTDDRAAFDCLTRTPVTFGYRDATAELRATRPMIGVDVAGRIREVRYNSRSMQPMRPPRGSAPDQAALQMQEFYRAYRTFATTLLHQDLTLRFSLEPGDCVVFDNTRVLHSRTGFIAGRGLAGQTIPHPDHQPAALAGRLRPPFLNPVEPVAEPLGHRDAADVGGIAVDLHAVHAVQGERNRGQRSAGGCTVTAACLASGDPVPDLHAAVRRPPVQGNFPDEGASLGGQHRVGVAETRLPAVISFGDPG